MCVLVWCVWHCDRPVCMLVWCSSGWYISLQEMQQQIRHSIEQFPVSDGQGAWQANLHKYLTFLLLYSHHPTSTPTHSHPPYTPSTYTQHTHSHRLVLSYLVHHGYSRTAQVFSNSCGQLLEEDAASIRNRQSEQNLVSGSHRMWLGTLHM